MTPADTPPVITARTAPFLSRVRIRNYKSIRFCEVNLQPLTVFVGRNGSGKSNFFDALAFLRDLMNGPVSAAVDSRGGWKRVLRRGASQPEIEIRFDAAFDAPDGPCEATYTLKLRADAAGRVSIPREQLTLSGAGTTGHAGSSYEVEHGQIRWTFPTGPDGPRGQQMFLGHLGGPFLSISGIVPQMALADLVRSSGVFAFEPSAMRPLQPQGVAVLATDGRNLAAALRLLTERDSGYAERVGQFLSAAVPQVVSCKPVPIGDYETVRFEVVADKGGGSSPFDAAAMSDGTLRTLAALVAAYQVLPSGRPGFVAIEEPESGVHPFVADVLMAAFDEAALTTQILVSTHSPDLLDAREVTPERVRIVQFIDGETVIGPVGEVDVSIVRDDLSTLGEMERGDRLQVDDDLLPAGVAPE